VPHAWSYGPVLRVADGVHGWQDRKVGADCRLVAMPWFVRISATRSENDQRQVAQVQDSLRDTVTALDEAFGQLLEVDAQIPELAARAAGMAPADLTAAGGAEKHLSEEAVATRRAREHQVKVKAVNAQISAVRGQQQDLVRSCLTLRAKVVEEYGIAQAVSERQRSFYSRRVATYARRLGRQAKSADLEFCLDPAPWTQGPCPWLPPGLTARLNTPAVAVASPEGTDEKKAN
jgi:hypothetical protein